MWHKAQTEVGQKAQREMQKLDEKTQKKKGRVGRRKIQWKGGTCRKIMYINWIGGGKFNASDVPLLAGFF